MAKEEWGTKRVCPTTGRRFYDLNRTPVISPYTGEVVDIDSVRRRTAGVAMVGEHKAARLIEDEIDTDDLIETGAGAEADLDEELLEDDDETVSLDDLADVPGDDDEV